MDFCLRFGTRLLKTDLHHVQRSLLSGASRLNVLVLLAVLALFGFRSPGSDSPAVLNLRQVALYFFLVALPVLSQHLHSVLLLLRILDSVLLAFFK